GTYGSVRGVPSNGHPYRDRCASRTGRLAVDNAAALPTAPTFAHKLHSLPPPMFMNQKSGTAGFYGGDKYSDAGGSDKPHNAHLAREDAMSEQNSGTSWWQTLPGVLTGIAAVITAVGGLILALHQSGVFEKRAANPTSPDTRDQRPPVASAGKDAAQASAVNAQPGDAALVRAGHYTFKLLGTKLEPYPGSAQKSLVSLSIRVTDVLGRSDYVDRRTIRLSVDGAELLPENSINFAVDDRQSVETQARFVIPADASTIVLLLGRAEDAIGRLPLTLKR
ncbi:MAG TPA: hypothetical protein PKJ45_07295, partial [Rubrivivax sp.]|nr:hypothetical protein [Rubrivivax sp.]